MSAKLVTAASQLGAVPRFSYFDVPGFPGVKFDQFPGSPSPFRGNLVAFKGNFADGATTRTGVYWRNVFATAAQVRKIADTTDLIPGTAINFGSTAPPSADGTRVVFNGSDNEDAPTAGGIYVYDLTTRALRPLVRIGDIVPGDGNPFTKFGEGLSLDRRTVGFWGSWGTATRTVRLHCPVDGQADVIAECKKQCPATDEIGNYCERQVPVHQGIFVKRPGDHPRRVAVAGARSELFQDFLFWVFSGAPPRPGSDAEPPRWRSSAFVAISTLDGNNVATAFKATKHSGETGVYIRRRLKAPIEPEVLVGDGSRPIDRAAPVGSRVSAVGIEREGFRNCNLALTVSFLNAATSESWAGVYLKKNACAL